MSGPTSLSPFASNARERRIPEKVNERMADGRLMGDYNENELIRDAGTDEPTSMSSLSFQAKRSSHRSPPTAMAHAPADAHAVFARMDTDPALLIDEMRATVSEAIPGGARAETVIPFLSLLRAEEITRLQSTFLHPSFCLVVQGQKRICFGSETVAYGPGDYVVSTLEMTTGAQIVSATRTSPYLGVRIALSAKEIASILAESKLDISMAKAEEHGAFVGTADVELLEAMARLLRLIGKPGDAAFLAGSVKREIIYRLLAGANGPRLYRSLVQDQQFLGVGQAIEFLKQHFADAIDTDALARSVEMSVSSLRHKFKTVTGLGMLQYQKRLRLQEARRLLLSGSVDVATSAYRVGYESQSQFSREYARMFGTPPVKDLRHSKARRPGAILQD